MLVSYKWLKSYVDFHGSVDELCDILTSTGLEVEEVRSLSGVDSIDDLVVVGEVVRVQKHPDADSLTVCTVKVGKEDPLQIVCGAPNVAAGQMVPVACVGSVLTNEKGESLKIKKARLRGVDSMGMICAEDELGLGDDHNGILVLDNNATPGVKIKDYLGSQSDYLIEIAITPNRGDANSYLGVARDVAAFLGTTVIYPETLMIKESGEVKFDVVIEEPELCPRYSGVVVSGITVGDSPEWLKEKIRSMGLNPVNNIVDAGNFLMFENGQPLHAFDFDKLEGQKIIVKRLPQGTPFETLDGTEIKLNGQEIMICDAVKGVAMGGVMGGKNTMVDESTSRILIESAYFNPGVIRKASKNHGFATDAAYRFERGTDPNFTVLALHRAAALISEVTGGHVSSEIVDNYPFEITPCEIKLEFKFVRKLSGFTLNNEEIRRILLLLEYLIVEETDNYLLVQVPTYRPDVERKEDLVEEILRIYSYDKVPVSEHFTTSLPDRTTDLRNELYQKFNSILVGNGYFELMTPSFTSPDLLEKTGLTLQPVKAMNAVNQNLDTMRTDLCVTALEAIAYNHKRKIRNVRFFEIGKIYFQVHEKFLEEEKLGIWVAGDQQDENWYTSSKPVDIFSLKKIVYTLMNTAGIETARLKQKKTLNEGKFNYKLEIYNRKIKLAELGQLKKTFYKHFDISSELFYAELNLSAFVDLYKSTPLSFTPVSKFPSISRDLAIVLDKKVDFYSLKNSIMNLNIPFLKKLNIFDVYEGEKVGNENKSYGIRLVFRDENRTLNDPEIDKVMVRILKMVEKTFSATIRS